MASSAATELKVPVTVAFVLAKPGDTLFLGIDPEQYRKMTDQEKYETEQMVRNRIPNLGDCVVVPAAVMGVYTPDENP